AQPGRRLLRDDAGTHRGHRQCGARPGATRRPRPGGRGMSDAPVKTLARHTRLSGLEPLTITPESNFINVGERTNVTGSAKFKKLILDDRCGEAVAAAPQRVESGAEGLDVHPGGAT